MSPLIAYLLAGATMTPVPAPTAVVQFAAGAPQNGPGFVPQPTPTADRLANAMRTLGRQPQDLEALIEAAEASALLEDGPAALQFLARAEKVRASDPRLPAIRGRAYVRMGRPGEALRQFAIAERAGAAPAGYASDRGLAYDLVGDQPHAQAEYARALAVADEAETRRRQAISFAISGDGKAADTALDPLLRQQDRAAWRTRALAMALAGDTGGAEKVTASMMPGFATAYTPLFRRLSEMRDPADRAFAAHLGEFTRTPARTADARLAPPVSPLPVAVRPPVQVAQVDPGATPSPVAAARTSARDAARDRARERAAARAAQAERRAAVRQRLESASRRRDDTRTAMADARFGTATRVAGANSARSTSRGIESGGAGSTVAALAARPAAVGAAPAALRASEAAVAAAASEPLSAAPVTEGPGTGAALAASAVSGATPSAIEPTTAAGPASLANVATDLPVTAASPNAMRPYPSTAVSPGVPGAASPAAPEAGGLPTGTGGSAIVAATRASPTVVPDAVPGPGVVETSSGSGSAPTGANPAAGGSNPAAPGTASQPPQMPSPAGAPGEFAAASASGGVAPVSPAGDATGTSPVTAVPGFIQPAIASAPPASPAAATDAGTVPANNSETRVGREDDVLAAIVRGIAVPGSELGITPPPVATPAGASPGIEAGAPVPVTAPAAESVVPPPASSPPPAARAEAPPVRKTAASAVETEGAAKKVEATKPEAKKTEAKKAEAKKAEAKKAEARKPEPKKPAEPARWWVQVAGGANVNDLPKAWNALAAKSTLLKGRQAWTTPLRFTNRLLTGPFASGGEAQAFVNKLGGAGLSAFTFESEAGQKVTRLPAK